MSIVAGHAAEAVSVRTVLYLEPGRMAARFGTVPSLDGLRGLSITIVLLSHFISEKIPGGLGVYVFFVISGFLITRLLFAEWRQAGTVNVKHFYIRRVLRLYPVILLYTVVVTASYTMAGRAIDWMQPLSALFYFANYLYAYRFLHAQYDGWTPFGAFWSLSVEEHFYLLFPCLFCVLKAHPRRVALAMVATICLCLAARIAVAEWRPDLLLSRYFYYRTEFRLDSLSFGVLLAALCEWERGRRAVAAMASPSSFLVGLALIAASLAFRNEFFRETFRYTATGVGIMLIVAGVLFSGRLRIVQEILNSSAATWMGKISYSLYVWHLFTIYMVAWFWHDPHKAFAVPVYILLTMGMAAASYYWIERPITRLRHRFGSQTA